LKRIEISSATITRRFYVGTAAWNNPPDERASRPDDRSHLAHYATQFRAVQINSAFYRQHRRATYERWRGSTPRDFRFSVKTPRSITHEGALRHYRKELGQFLQEVAGLKSKLRVILVQTPASLAFEAAVSTRFFKSLSAAAPCRIVVEPRHPSWFSARAEALLTRYGVARAAADPARVPTAGVPSGGRGLVYFRLHGSPRMYYSKYNIDALRELSTNLTSHHGSIKEIWCIFDNTAQHAAWGTALTLRLLSA